MTDLKQVCHLYHRFMTKVYVIWHVLFFHIPLVAGSDYVAEPLQATFPITSIEGESSCVDIGILQDTVLEGDHSFGVEVTSATPSVVMVGTPSEETITILDDESRYTECIYSISKCMLHLT